MLHNINNTWWISSAILLQIHVNHKQTPCWTWCRWIVLNNYDDKDKPRTKPCQNQITSCLILFRETLDGARATENGLPSIKRNPKSWRVQFWDYFAWNCAQKGNIFHRWMSVVIKRLVKYFIPEHIVCNFHFYIFVQRLSEVCVMGIFRTSGQQLTMVHWARGFPISSNVAGAKIRQNDSTLVNSRKSLNDLTSKLIDTH